MLLLLSSAFCRNFEEIVLLSYLKITKACSNDLRRAKKITKKKVTTFVSMYRNHTSPQSHQRPGQFFVENLLEKTRIN